MVSIGALAVIASAILFCIATYQVISYRDFLSLTKTDVVHLPLHVYVEILLGVLTGIAGGYELSGALKPISPHIKQSMDINTYRMDFASFNARGSVMPWTLQQSHATR